MSTMPPGSLVHMQRVLQVATMETSDLPVQLQAAGWPCLGSVLTDPGGRAGAGAASMSENSGSAAVTSKHAGACRMAPKDGFIKAPEILGAVLHKAEHCVNTCRCVYGRLHGRAQGRHATGCGLLINR